MTAARHVIKKILIAPDFFFFSCVFTIDVLLEKLCHPLKSARTTNIHKKTKKGNTFQSASLQYEKPELR
jgi:hypothetical protein